MKLIKLLPVILICMILCTSCNSKGELKDFDPTKLKTAYELDLTYTNDEFEKRKETDSTIRGMDNLTMATTLAMKGKFTFDPNDKTLFTSTNRFNPTNKTYDFFDFKIENDSIIYIKAEDADEFIKSAILLEYGSDYGYFIFKSIVGINKNFVFKAVAE
jgi:hypothetical protein